MRHLSRALLTLAIFALSAALASDARPARAEAVTSPRGDVITTELQPGWNMLGWLGPETPVSDLFEAVPELERVFVWLGEHQRYEWATRNNPSNRRLPLLTPGRGFWMYVGGTATVEWTRPIVADPVLLSLHQGGNLVAWTGADGTPIEEAVARFGRALEGAARWNPVTERFEHYRPGAPGGAGTLRELRYGDAFFIDLSEAARWWQSRTARTQFVVAGDVSDERQAEIRARTASVLALYAEQYGILPPEFSVVLDPRLSGIVTTTRSEIVLGRQGVEEAAIGPLLTREYSHLLQQQWAGDHVVPAWLSKGASAYASGLHQQVRGETNAAQLRADRRADIRMISIPPLDQLEDARRYRSAGPSADSLSALAVESIEVHAALTQDEAPSTGGTAFISFYQSLGSSEDWRQSFEAAFGIPVDAFYVAFAAERGAPDVHPVHMFDARHGPVIIFLGDVPSDVEAAARADVIAAQAFFAEHFRAEPADYTIYVAANWPSAEHAFTTVFERESTTGPCVRHHWQNVAFKTLPCSELLRSSLGWVHFRSVQERIAPRAGAYVPGPDGVHPQGADWLHRGTELYAHYAYLQSLDPEAAQQLRDQHVAVASWSGDRLRDIESQGRTHYTAGLLAAWGSRGFFAAEWLAEHVGAPALLDYYRVVASGPPWRGAFEEAFGMSVDAFYEVAEPYISEIASPIPHLADDRDEPILVLLGDISSAEAAAARRDFDAAQEFFGERLGAPAADYTVYVAADDESALPAFRKAFAKEPDPGFCFYARQGTALVMTLDCGRPLAERLGAYHFNNVHFEIQQTTGFPTEGPWWLRLGLAGYAEHAYFAAARPEGAPERRTSLAFAAGRTALSLRSLETYQSGITPPVEVIQPLGSFAVEWLVERAGEQAVLDYYLQRFLTVPWQDTFETVFGISLDDFYEAFAAYRAEVAPPR